MKKILLLSLFCIVAAINSYAQLTISMATGTSPTLPPGWLLNGSASAPAPAGSMVQLTPPAGSLAGQVYYNTLTNLTACGQFNVDFDFQIISAGAASFAIADGISFFFINPLTAFVAGGGLGLPNPLTGFVFALDPYDNDGDGINPEIEMFGYGTASTYNEADPGHRLGPILGSQTWMTDGNWHHVKISYNGGNITVFLNGSTSASLTGYFPITTAGYFGFTGSTGGAWSTQNVKNVYITSSTISAITGPTTICSGTTTFSDATPGGTWSSSNPAVASIGPTTGIATGLTAGTTNITYFYSSTCQTSMTITVNPMDPTVTGASAMCPGSPVTFSDATSGGTWSSSNTSVATVGASSGVVTGVSNGTAIISYLLPVGCYGTKVVTVSIGPPPITVTPTSSTICNSGSVTLNASTSPANYNLIPIESWESGVPITAGTPVDAWDYIGTTNYWAQGNGSTVTNPIITGAASGVYLAQFKARTLASGSTATLVSPSFSMTGVSSGQLTFYVYRDVSAYNTAAYNLEGVNVYINTTPSLAGATTLGFVPRRGGLGITGPLTGTGTTATSGWQQYTVSIPAAFTGATNYIMFNGVGQAGNNIYLDSITLKGTVVPVWSPTTYLFSDAGFTTTYTGSGANTVYVHPTSVSSPTSVTYTASASNGICTSSATSFVSINPVPAAITGSTPVCIGATITLSNTVPGGSWTSDVPGTATVVSSTGVVTGVAAGTVTMTYAFGACYSTVVVTVNSTPAVIGGTPSVCVGNNTTLTNSVPGGTWTSSNTTVGTINAVTGVLSGLTSGTTIVTYGLSAICITTVTVTVNAVAPITGTAFICVGLTATLSDATPGGNWTSGNLGVATVGATTGIVNGLTGGTAVITYTSPAGCTATTIATVNSNPSPVTGTNYVCTGMTTTLADATFGGTWSSSNTSVATISSSGVVTGVAGGTSTITYSLGAGCISTVNVFVNTSPAAITGGGAICSGGTLTLSDATPAGTWSATGTGGAINSSTGVVSGTGVGGTLNCTYTIAPVAPMPTGCYTTTPVTVNPLPAAISGPTSVCVGNAVTLADASVGGTWSLSNAFYANIDPSTGIITGLNPGAISTTYTLPTGCIRVRSFTVTAGPAAISGTLSVCEGFTTTLTDATTGGTWSSSFPGIGTVGSANGVVGGVLAGNTVITYSVGGCTAVAIVTVYGTPPAITGIATVCPGTTTTLANSVSGGTWSASSGLITINSSGVVTGGGTLGTSTVTYSLGGCITTRVVTVTAAPAAIGGTLNICEGYVVTLTDASSPGTWSSSNTTVATITSPGGVLSGLTAGNSTIVFTANSSGCTASAIVTVNPSPAAISGSLVVCIGTGSSLSSATSGGTWSAGAPGTGSVTISSSGYIQGVTQGTTTISYTSSTGCRTTAVATVNPLPANIGGTLVACQGLTATVTDAVPGGTWSNDNAFVANINTTTGVVTANNGGTTTVTYTLGTGCIKTAVFTVNPTPSAISGSTIACVGNTTPLTDATTGGTWVSAPTSIATINSATGMVTGVAVGTATVTYTVTATGCLTTTVITVNPQPAVITGSTPVCPGTTTTLSDATPGGNWSTTSLNASVDAATGIVTGVSAGTAVVTYMLSATGCYRTTVVTVNPLSGAISGTMTVCVGSATLLTNSTTGGTWFSGTPSVATIGNTSGIVSGISGGTSLITYKLTATGCQMTAVVTVNPLPATIGAVAVCVGSAGTVTNASGGGTWSTASPIITLNTTTGEVVGIGAGTARVTYTLPTGCFNTGIVTVNPLPAAIGGTLSVCPGLTTTLTDASPLGTWSIGSPSVGTGSIGASNGVFTGGTTPGTVTVIYTLPTTCTVSALVTVNPLPSAVSGGTAVCLGQTTTLTDATTGGTWQSSNPGVGSVDASGVVTGITVGTTTITYKLTSTGCYATQVVSVNGLPPAIGGTLALCPGTCTTLTNGATGGTWAVSAGTGTATIGSTSGYICGGTAGTVSVTYTVGTGCITSTTVTVNPTPPAITGSLGVCIGFYSTLSDPLPGGTWSMTSPSIATIDASGVVHGVGLGTVICTYTAPATGCITTAIVTVNPLPAPITGSTAFCNLTTTTLHDASSGGTWTSADTNIVAIDTFSGVITGHNPGSTTVTYTLPTGCYTTRTQGIILAPYPVTGPHDVCQGNSITLSNVVSGGTWSSSASGTASIDVDSAYVNGIAPGVATMTYTLSNGCYSEHDVTVNVTPVSIVGNLGICYGLASTLHDATTGGAWSSDNTTIAPITSGGVVTALGIGTANITYSMSTGCYTSSVVTVYPLPAPIDGVFELCLGSTTTVSDTSTGGTWISNAPGIAPVDPSTGVVYGLGVGIATINYILSTGCTISQDVTVNPLPDPISGASQLCVGGTIALIDTSSGGTWSSADVSIATVDASGIVTGTGGGTVAISYILPTGCYTTAIVTVNGLPPAISGPLHICAGFTGNLLNGIPGGLWTTDGTITGIGTLNMYTGVVTGIAPGTFNVTYTLPSGCSTNTVVTVNPLPSPVSGTFKVCLGSTTTLDDVDAGGTWSSSNPAVGSVDFITGIVTGVSAGTVDITYTLLATGCINKAVVTVNPLPALITGPSQVCENATITLTSATPVSGHGWESMTPSIATVGMTTGIVTGVSAGTVVINFTNTTTLCSVSKVITVNAVPAAIVGPNGVCLSSTVTLTDATTGGTWSSSNPAAAPISASGVVSGVALGNTIITYKLTSNGCQALKPMTVNALPNLYNVVGGGNYCEGGNGVPISLDGSQIGIGYALYYGSSATGYLTGTGAPLNFGLLTMAGTYHVIATNGITGCSREMVGTAPVIIDPSVTPLVNIHSTSGTDTVCPGGPIAFSAAATNGGSAPTYLWKVNGTAVSTASVYNYTPASGDVITLKLTSNAHCAVPTVANDTMNVVVIPSSLPVAGISIDPGDTVCKFNMVTFTGTAAYGGYAPVFVWSVNGTYVATGPEYSYVPDSLDLVKVMLVSNYQCRLADTVYSTGVTMVVEPLKIPHVDVTAYPGLYIAEGQPDTLVATATNAGTHPTYQWKVNSIPVAGATNPTFIAVFHDYDSVACEVTSSDVCHGVASFDWVFINLHPVGVGSTSAGLADIKLMPNPNKGTFFIKGSLGNNSNEELAYEVTDMLGQVVYRSVVKAKQGNVEERIALSDELANGMYLLNLKTASAQQTFHFVVEK